MLSLSVTKSSELGIITTIAIIQRISSLNIFPLQVNQWDRQSGGSRRPLVMRLFHFQTGVREGQRICGCDKTTVREAASYR